MQNSSSLVDKFLRVSVLSLQIVSILFAFGVTTRNVSAQTDEITWASPINLSNSPDATSSDPIIVADSAGNAHLFWAEKMGTAPGNSTDTVMYAKWDGKNWSKPIDVFFSPYSDGNPIVNFPHAVMDDESNIHLIWLSEPNAPNYTLNYSSVPSSQADRVSAWNTRVELADDLTGTLYAIDIAYSPPQTLHVIFARGAQGAGQEKERSVTYIRSTDGGESWSEPADIHVIYDLERGASHTRLLVEPPNRVYASWTEWDATGTGQAIYFSRSLDGGDTWESPIKLTERVDDEYERDWNSLVLLGENKLMAMWEGGYRAYRYAMYSEDGGETWSYAVDTFPWLIGENGFAEFARDSSDILHLFISQRVREGEFERPDAGGLYHSVWEGDQRWRDPVLSGGVNPMVNPKVVIYNGNRVMVTWFSNLHLEIMVMSGEIGNTPAIAPVIPPTPIVVVTPTESSIAIPMDTNQEVQPSLTPTFSPSNDPPSAADQFSSRNIIIIGVFAPFLVTAIFIVFKKRKPQQF